MPFVTYGPVGCSECTNGFKGRLGLYEAILTDEIIANLMTRTPPPTEREIKRAAEHQGIFTMIEDGVIKILTGVTSFDEIQSVVDLSEDEDMFANAAVPPLPRGGVVSAANDGGVNNSDSHPSVSLEAVASQLPFAGEQAGQWQLENNSGEELSLLVDYLKLLESMDLKNPETNLAQKIERAKHMILAILENSPNLEKLFSSPSPAVAVKSQIESLVNDLHELQLEQEKNPQLSVAEKLSGIRSTIETMTREVAT
jgi:hypothetical protein